MTPEHAMGCSLPVGRLTAAGTRIIRAGRYDDDGKLVEVVEADPDGRITIPTAGFWYIMYGNPKVDGED